MSKRETKKAKEENKCCPTCGRSELTLREAIIIQAGIWEWERWHNPFAQFNKK